MPILSLRSEPRVLTNVWSQLLIDRIDNRIQWLPARHDTARPRNIWQLEIFLFVPRRQKEINIGILWAGARDAIMYTISQGTLFHSTQLCSNVFCAQVEKGLFYHPGCELYPGRAPSCPAWCAQCLDGYMLCTSGIKEGKNSNRIALVLSLAA